jgi:flagellar motor switch protein FliN
VANDSDDLLDPAEIEALLNPGGKSPTPGPSKPAGAAAGPAAGAPEPMSQQALDALLQQHAAPKPAPGKAVLGTSEIDELLRGQAAARGPEATLQQAESHLARAMAAEATPRPRNEHAASARPFEFENFSSDEDEAVKAELGTLKDVELDLRIELGRAELLVEDVLKLREGSVVPLDKLAGDLVNGRLIARGEVLVLNDNFCVRVAEILTPQLN